MSMNQDEIKDRLRRAIGAVGEIPAGYANLGRGDGSGTIVASAANRIVYVYGTNLAGQVKLAQDIFLGAINKPQLEGLRVRLGYPNYDSKVLYMTGYDTGEGLDALGGVTLNEQQSSAAQYPDVGKIANLRMSPNNPTDLNIFVGPTGYYDTNGVWKWFGGDGLDDDFTADIAALSSQHQMAVVYLDTVTGNLGRVLNTAETGGAADKDTFNATTIAGLTFKAGWILCGAVHLYDGQTTIEEVDIYRSSDPRVIYPTPQTSYATLQTTNNTQTTLASVAVGEASLLTLTGTFSGVKDDYSAAISGTFVAGIRRITGGNATLVGVTVTSNEDSSGTPALTVDADTGTQTARIRVTGITAENWNWTVRYQTLVS